MAGHARQVNHMRRTLGVAVSINMQCPGNRDCRQAWPHQLAYPHAGPTAPGALARLGVGGIHQLLDQGHSRNGNLIQLPCHESLLGKSCGV